MRTNARAEKTQRGYKIYHVTVSVSSIHSSRNAPYRLMTVLRWSSMLVTCLLVFAAQMGVQTLPFLLSGELFASDVRAVCKGLCRGITCALHQAACSHGSTSSPARRAALGCASAIGGQRQVQARARRGVLKISSPPHWLGFC